LSVDDGKKKEKESLSSILLRGPSLSKKELKEIEQIRECYGEKKSPI
jgi:hypothetical protein